MSQIIKSLNEIDNIENINDISITEIERRAKKIEDNTTDETWRVRSFEGYLGLNESFKERLKKDWILLNQWNNIFETTIDHITIASFLKDIINQCEEHRQSNQLGPMTPITLEYSTPNQLLLNNDKQQTIKQKLLISKQLYNGFQYSIFYNDQNTETNNSSSNKFNFITKLFHKSSNSTINWNKKWNYEYIIENQTMVNNKDSFKNSIKIAGGTDEGIIQFIETLGFYEGDELNEYRIDPILLLSLLNGYRYYQHVDEENTSQFSSQSKQTDYNNLINNIIDLTQNK